MFLVKCSGINLGTLYGIRNTNPTPDYANIYGLQYTGGGVFHKNSVPGALGFNAESKTYGKGCSLSLLYLFSFGDSSIGGIKKEFSITKIEHIEYEQLAVLGFIFHSFCTKIYGE